MVGIVAVVPGITEIVIGERIALEEEGTPKVLCGEDGVQGNRDLPFSRSVCDLATARLVSLCVFSAVRSCCVTVPSHRHSLGPCHHVTSLRDRSCCDVLPP